MAQVHDIVRAIDSNNDGLVSAQDFKSAFWKPGDEEQVLLQSRQHDTSSMGQQISIQQVRATRLCMCDVRAQLDLTARF